MTAGERFDKDGETQETVGHINPDLQGNGYWIDEETDSYIIDADEVSMIENGQSLEGRRATDGVGRQFTDEVGRQSTDEDDGVGDGIGVGVGVGGIGIGVGTGVGIGDNDGYGIGIGDETGVNIGGSNYKSGMNGSGSIGKNGIVCAEKSKAYTGTNGTVRKVKSPKPHGRDGKAKPPEPTG